MANEILSQSFTDEKREEHLSVLKKETDGFYIINVLKDRILNMLEESYELGYEQGADDHY